MAKTDAILKTLRSLFTNKASAAQTAKAQPSAPVPAQPPEDPVLSEKEIEKIKDSDFTKQNELFDAINAGVKIASDKQTARYSFFKSHVSGWLEMYKKLKPKDFGNPKESTKWKELMINMSLYTSNPKKLLKGYADGQDIYVLGYSKSTAVKAKMMIEIIEKLQSSLAAEELNYLNNHKVPDSTPAIAEALANLKSLEALPEAQKTNLYKIAEPHEEKIKLEQLIKIYNVFSTFTDHELKIASQLCFYDTTHYYANHPNQDLGFEDANGDFISILPPITCKNPVERLKKNLKWAKETYKQYSKTGKRKPVFNKTKVQYLAAMHAAVVKSMAPPPKTAK